MAEGAIRLASGAMEHGPMQFGNVKRLRSYWLECLLEDTVGIAVGASEQASSRLYNLAAPKSVVALGNGCSCQDLARARARINAECLARRLGARCNNQPDTFRRTNGAPVHAVSQIVREFFERYERSRNTMDAGLIDEQYPDAFTFAGPTGARIAEKQAVIASLSKGHQFLKTLGHRSTSLVSLDEMTLDEHYTLVRAKFVWRFEKPSAQPIDVEVDSTFILCIQDAMPRIVFQQEHEDFQQALRARGVLP